MHRVWIAGGLSVLVAASALNAQTVTDSNLQVDGVITAGLTAPVAIAFFGPNDYFVIERGTGKVRVVLGGVLEASAALDLPINSSGERGFLGIAVDPGFSTNAYVYLYYCRSSTGADGGAWSDSRVERYVWDAGTKTLISPFNVITFGSSALGTGINNFGGPLKFGPDGKLYGVTGDFERNGREQNYATAAFAGVGGFFRLNSDGTVPLDNPLNVDGVDPAFQRLYGYGVRNCFGFSFDTKTGRMWDTENGPTSMDEINLVLPGFNSGWEDVMGPIALTTKTLADLYFPIGVAQYSDPEYSWKGTIAPTGLVFLHSAKFSTIRDQMVVGDNNNGALYLYTLNANRDDLVLTGGNADRVADSVAERNVYRFGTGWGVITDLQIGPDGNLWVVSLTLNRILKIRPKTIPNTISGRVTLSVFSALPTGTPLTIELKNGGSTVETTTTTIGAYGDYYVSPTNAGTFDIVAKASHWLAQKASSVTVGMDTKLDWAMTTNGDLFQDNQVDLFDLNKILVDFTGPTGDLDGNGVADVLDLNTCLINFGLIGAS